MQIDIEYLRARDDWWSCVDVGQAGECWNWKLSCGSHGYGTATVGRGRRQTTAHRAAWTLTYGAIPDGLTVDHLCRNRRCCNPTHLRLMTNVDNARLNGNAIKTHCPRGHAYTTENTRTNDRGHRWCRACQDVSNDSRYQRKVA